MSIDRIETLGRSRIQHGRFNDRVYLMHAHPRDLSELPERLEKLAQRREYSKIFAKIPARAKGCFLRRGFKTEAKVPGFYLGRETGLFMGKYLSRRRERDRARDRVEQVRTEALSRQQEDQVPKVATSDRVRILEERHAQAMAEIYDRVFPTYPFPINDPEYIRETMRSNVRYFGISQEGSLVALASAEMDPEAGNVEMTDFATLPRARGQGMAGELLGTMERSMAKEGLPTAYTIARARSFGMNIVFARAGYGLGGTLVNNTNISGRLESMNVWYKPLTSQSS